MIPQIAAILMLTAASIDQSLTWKQLPPLPDPLGVAAPYAGVSGNALLVAGGANFPGKMPWEGGKKIWHDQVWLLDRPVGSWRSIGKLPHPLAYGVSVTARDSVVCVGGSDSEKHYSDVIRLIWNSTQLLTESLPPMPMPLANASGALVDDTLYVACGAEQPGEQSASNRVFTLSLGTEKPEWRELPPLPGKPRLLATAAVFDGEFYIIGGAALEPSTGGKISRVYLRDAWAFRAGRGWRRIADLPKPNVAAASPAPVVEGKILLVAGDDGSHVGFTPPEKHPGFPRTVFRYDPALDQWSEGHETPAPRATLPTVQWHGSTIFPSGEVRPGVRSPEVWAITPR